MYFYKLSEVIKASILKLFETKTKMKIPFWRKWGSEKLSSKVETGESAAAPAQTQKPNYSSKK